MTGAFTAIAMPGEAQKYSYKNNKLQGSQVHPIRCVGARMPTRGLGAEILYLEAGEDIQGANF